MDKIRAYRRSRRAAMQAKARRIYPHDPIARSANHLKVCSCWMCGNPRRYKMGGTMAEHRAAISAQQAISDALDERKDR